MHVAERFGSGFGRRVQGHIRFSASASGRLSNPEEVSASTLRLVSVDMRVGLRRGGRTTTRCRVRQGEAGLVLLREPACFGEVGMLVDVVSHDRERCPTAIVDDHSNSFAVFAVEVGEVDHFGWLAFGEDEECGLGGAAQALAPDSCGARFSSTAANSASLTIGSAPYMPWR